MARLLVLGGTAWLGRCLARAAVDRGHDVTVLARGESGDPPAGVTVVVADRDSQGAYDEVVDQRWDGVVDVSRQPGQVRSAVAALGGTTSHWTLVSTGSVYADQSGDLTEDSALLSAATEDVVGADRYGEGKVACEESVLALRHSLVVRAGLIGGPGDPVDRVGYYVARHALAGEGDVLVPAVRDQPMQVLDVRDLASWLVRLTEDRTTGVLHAAGAATTVGEILDLSASVAGCSGRQAEALPSWLHEHDVQEWMGPRSLPLWLPSSHHGMGRMDDGRAVAAGLQRRPLSDTLVDTLADERERGLDRDRAAGLTRADELDLLAALA